MVQEACISFAEYYKLYKRKRRIDMSIPIERPLLSEIKGKIEFKGVSFYYPSNPNKIKILDKLDLLFEAGKKIALVGDSGCGKSTIANLIERFYDVNEGQILIDGINIKDYDIAYLRSCIGYVQQEPVLFNKSIRENIIFGREEHLKYIADIDHLLQKVSKEVYIDEFIDTLPGKYNYNVGVKGGNLSGGQKQRIAIARAILMSPKILILDEATSSLDNKSEREVQRALDNISNKNVTTLIIAHRLSTIKNADIIYVMKNGKIIEKGNHQELLKKKVIMLI
jgi:ABC-type multidrug transport system fused ATPase/permease subunit